VARSLDLPNVEEGFTGTVRQLDEAEAFLGVESLRPSVGLATGARPGRLLTRRPFEG
jgi:hypothetical protein